MNDRNQDWEAIGLSNDFLFGKVMQDPQLCKELLELILPELQIERIEYPELQKSVKPDADAKSVRLDVYVKDCRDVVYDIEMQATDTRELPKRSRYYQSMIDLQLIDAGQPYKGLNCSFIIFICPADVFGADHYLYTFENVCREAPELSLQDGTTKIFLNASGHRGSISRELKAFLDYIAGKSSDDIYVQKLEKAVREAKKNREWRHEYMTLFMRDQENLERGREQGRLEGQAEERNHLTLKMLKSGKYTCEEIAFLTDQSIREIQEIRNSLTL